MWPATGFRAALGGGSNEPEGAGSQWGQRGPWVGKECCIERVGKKLESCGSSFGDRQEILFQTLQIGIVKGFQTREPGDPANNTEGVYYSQLL